MTDDQHGDPHGDQHAGGTPPGGSRWDPLPQGDYDDGATAFVKLPEGGVDALLASSESPLAAPGHGYVPPQITVAPATTAGTDPAATGSWAVPSAPSAPVDGAQWQAPDAGQDPAAHQGYGDYAAQQDPYGGAAPYGGHAGQGVPGHDDRFAYQPGATGQWDFSQASQNDLEAGADRHAPGQDVTGQWSIPVADGDLPDESGEFTTSSLAEQWGTGAPATLPGGAPAPWATQPTGRPWGEDPARTGPAEDRGTPSARPAGQPWGEAAAPAGPSDAERSAASPHGPGPAQSGHGYDPTASGHGQGHGPDAAVGLHEPDATAPAHGPGTGVSGHGYDSTEGGHGHGPDGSVGPHEPDATASAHGPGPGASPDGFRPADGPYAHAPGDIAEPEPEPEPETEAAADPGVPADDGTAGPATGLAAGSGTVADGPRGAEEAPEGPTGRSPDPAEEARPESHPEAPEGPLAGQEPAAGRESLPEPAQEHGRRDDAVDARTGADGEGTDVGATEADPDGAREPAAPAGPQEEHPLASYVLRVNGADRPVTDAWIGESLLYVLRERLGLAGAKDGCSQGECGACNVQVDGRLVASCLVPSVTAAGSEVRTVEGLATDGQPSDVQRALARRGAVQCGFCVPGMAMTVHNLLEGNPAPTELEARQALCGNLCRCSGYRGVLEAVQEVVAEREAHAEADAQAGAGTEEPRIPHQAGPGAGGVNPAAFESRPPPGAQDPTGPHDQSPYGDHGDHGDHGTHGRDGGHA
ncbi:2Fe-2S iron-sulfur cluster-binding protein [Streptomyces sp. NPDC005549]|uniref:2Fe-2S iron-sulfur cluster-binding protein n=1 Tax=Streptomyces sp. NPDC005549 TaxID=3154888 RepID=UPI0033A6257A